MHKILIVEDDAVIAAELCRLLGKWGYEARAAEDLAHVSEEFSAYAPQLVIMDISLPFYNGFYWCAQIRTASSVPVVFLSSRSDNMDIVMAMNMGGDDFITKPFQPDVLVAKVGAVLRRAYSYETPEASLIRGVRFDAAALALYRGEEKFALTRNEARILQTLLAHRGGVCSREQLMMALWDTDSFIDDNTLSVNVNRLRRTLAQAGLAGCITTHKNEGYAIGE